MAIPILVTRLPARTTLVLSEGLLSSGMAKGKKVAKTATAFVMIDLVVDLAALLMRYR